MPRKEIFGMESSSDSWRNIRTAYAEYKGSSLKKVESIQYIVDGLNHLREWIARESDGTAHAAEAKKFCKKLENNNAYVTIKKISNGAKHYNAKAPKVSPKYKQGSVMADWGVLSRMGTMAQGSPADFVLGNGENIIATVDDVMLEYTKWFDRTSN